MSEYMARITQMLIVLWVTGIFSATMLIFMEVYLRGRYEIFTHLSKYVTHDSVGSRENITGLVENSTSSVMCSLTNESLLGNIADTVHFDLDPPSWEEIIQEYPDILPGGSYKPSCTSRHRVAIIIPLRNREMHLRRLLAHMHKIWKRQLIDYTVYAVTQSGTEPFNRGKLMNIGFAEANKERKYDCYVFHDVDLLLENDNCLYWCPNASNDNPNHLAAHVSKFNYNILQYNYPNCYPPEFDKSAPVMYFGGVSLLSHDQFTNINGFSNIYWGWGGEDDDLYFRVRRKGYNIINEDPCRYGMIVHKGASDVNPSRMKLLWNCYIRQDEEGLNSLNYTLLHINKEPLYTEITVDLGKPSEAFRAISIASCQGKIDYKKLI